MSDIPPPLSKTEALLILVLAMVAGRHPAFEEAGVIFTEPTKTRGPGVCLKE
jgi:hypothetical protein